MREFVVLCEYLNFTVAAKELYTTQPGLSYRIASMEKELGFTLIERGQPLRVTPAGKVFLAEAQGILERYDVALARCAKASRQRGKLTVERPAGFPRASQGFDFLVSAFVRENPSVDVAFTSSTGRLLRDVLLDGTADLGVVFSDYDFSDDAELRDRVVTLPLETSVDARFYVWMHKDNPLTEKEHLYAEDLDGSRLAMQSDARFRIGWTSFERIFARYGVELSFRGKPALDGVDFLWHVEDDEIAITDIGWEDVYTFSFDAFPHRILRRIENDDLGISASLVYLANNPNPALERFAAFARRNAV